VIGPYTGGILGDVRRTASHPYEGDSTYLPNGLASKFLLDLAASRQSEHQRTARDRSQAAAVRRSRPLRRSVRRTR
jgi:hypothetical protein